MNVKLAFNGTGGEIFKELFVGALLTSITAGIYGPWFLVALNKYMYSRTRLVTPNGELQPEFKGTGGELFKEGLIGMLLVGITFGIYTPWFAARMKSFYDHNSIAKSSDGTVYGLRNQLNGGSIAKEFLIGMLLTGITFGIYAPWFVVKVMKIFSDNTQITQDSRVIGGMNFVGEGGEFFKIVLVGSILTGVTFGVYQAWYQVDVLKFSAENLRITVNGSTYSGAFHGTGGELFKTLFVGAILTGITFGIYSFWLIADLTKFQTNHLAYAPTGTKYPSVPAGVPMAAGVA